MTRTPNAEPAFEAAHEHILNACRCLAAAGLSDRAVAEFVRAAIEPLDPQTYDSAAAVLAEHCAVTGVSEAVTARLISKLAIDVPSWPDLDEIGAIVRHAYQEDEE